MRFSWILKGYKTRIMAMVFWILNGYKIGYHGYVRKDRTRCQLGFSLVRLVWDLWSSSLTRTGSIIWRLIQVEAWWSRASCEAWTCQTEYGFARKVIVFWFFWAHSIKSSSNSVWNIGTMHEAFHKNHKKSAARITNSGGDYEKLAQKEQ